MPWKRTDVREQRVQFVIRAKGGQEGMSRLCAEYGVSRPTGYRWLRRYEEVGSVEGLREHSRRPRHSPRQTVAELEGQVVGLRARYGWGARKLQVLLAREGVALPVVTIHRILRRRGLVNEGDSHPAAVQRFERPEPNQLWQMDGKGPYRLREGSCYPLSILDDHSRYAVGLYALRQFQAEPVHRCLVETFECYGVPEAMLMDHGSLWWGTTSAAGLTWLAVALIQQGIRLIYGRIRHPQTQGKVERFHRTLDQAVRFRGRPREWEPWPSLLAEVRWEYNHIRPHEALGMNPPASRYRPSPRSYCAHPPEWQYPAGSVVRRLNTQGCLDWDRERWFVCEALAGEWVRLEKLEQTILVSYRHMYIREIDLEKGRTTPLALSRDE